MPAILWLSDLHLDANQQVLDCDPIAACTRAVDHLAEHYADARCCVVSGDIANTGAEADYREAKAILDRLPMPWYPLVGNHDAREPLRKLVELPDTCMPDFVQYTVDIDAGTSGGAVRLVCLDTLIPGQDGGELCEARLAWLAQTLEQSGDKSVVVFLHHPPVTLGIQAFDDIGLRNADAVMQHLARHPCVQYVCAGHVHRAYTGVCQGIAFATQRSVLFQAPPARPPWDFSCFEIADEPAGFGVVHVDQQGVRIDFNQLGSALR